MNRTILPVRRRRDRAFQKDVEKGSGSRHTPRVPGIRATNAPRRLGSSNFVRGGSGLRLRDSTLTNGA